MEWMGLRSEFAQRSIVIVVFVAFVDFCIQTKVILRWKSTLIEHTHTYLQDTRWEAKWTEQNRPWDNINWCCHYLNHGILCCAIKWQTFWFSIQFGKMVNEIKFALRCFDNEPSYLFASNTTRQGEEFEMLRILTLTNQICL